MDSSVYIWNSKLLFFRKSISSAEHTHHAMQICLGLERPIGILDAEKQSGNYRLAIIDAECPHTIEAPDAHHAFLFIEPELVSAQRIREKYLSGERIVGLDFSLLEPFVDRLLSCYARKQSCADVSALVEEILGALASVEQPQRVLDDRVKKIIEFLKDAEYRPSLGELSAAVGLSESRLQHLFKEHMGVPMREYLLWRRLMQSLRHISQFGSLTEVAHEAGFSDSAHFSRTFKRMFGISPTDVLKVSNQKQAFPLFICGE